MQVNINQFVGLKIRATRIQRELGQSDMARMIGISTGSFSKIEHGYIDINIHRLKQIAAALQVEIDQLLPDTLSSTIAAVEKNITRCDMDISRLQQIITNLEIQLQKKPDVNSPSRRAPR